MVDILASLDKGGLDVGSLKAFNKALMLNWRRRLFQNSNALRVLVVKVIHCDEASVDLRGCQMNGVWASIVGTINHLHSSGIIPLSSIHFKDCFIRERILNGSWDWDWSRPITMGRTKTEFDNLMLDIASLKSDEIVGYDSCIWNLSNDDILSVNKFRKHIDECSLPMLSPSTRWYKMIPKKVNIFMWPMFLDRLPNRLNLSSRGLDLDSISCMVLMGLFDLVIRLLLFGGLFDLGLVFYSQPFAHVKTGTFGLIRGMLLRTRSLALIPSSRLPVGPFGVIETISLLTLNI
ncbi:hypothetical protein Tco_0983229 [Tanacetum coccineum]